MTTYTAGFALTFTSKLSDRRFHPIRTMIEAALHRAALSHGFEFYMDRGPDSPPTTASIVIGDVYDWAAAHPAATIKI
jgi:hypothetical protein